MKNIKCYCNDDTYCPLKKHSSSSEVSNNNNNNEYDLTRFCLTNTVCVTKRVRRSNGSTWLKYYCDHSNSNSIRDKVIEYRDCKINSTNLDDQKFVLEQSAEYCCNNYNFCNKDLSPVNSVLDVQEISKSPGFYEDTHTPNEHSIVYSHAIMFSTLNIVLLVILAVFLLITFVLIILYYIRNKHKYIDKLKADLNVLNSNANATNKKNSFEQTYTSSKSSKSTRSTMASSHLNSKNNTFDCYEWSGLSSDVDQPAHHNLNRIFETAKGVISEENVNLLPECFTNTQTTNTISSSKSSNSSCIATSLTTSTDSDFNNKENNLENYLNSANARANTASSSANSNMISTSGIGYNNHNTSSNEWSGSGSGAGVPELLQRSIARQIKLLYPCIGKGRFGEVYKGVWRDGLVAVKTFNSADEKSWQNECSIYNTSGFRHENILGFIAADNIDRGTYTELWIITEYHKNGSLFDYLNINTITIHDLFKMSISIVNGLDHLHTPIESCTGKPALAHCDLKSKNILVKSDLTCCIGDLGLALSGDKMGNVIFNSQSSASSSTTSSFLNNNDILKMNNNSRVVIRTGTKRYMAPEILSKSINIQSLLEFQYAEMYSLSLIFWELLRRTKSNELTQIAYEYKMPYYECLPNQDPDLEQMYQVVCLEKMRPELQVAWKEIPVLNEYTLIIEELWNENAHARLNALRLKKSLNSLYRRYFSK